MTRRQAKKLRRAAERAGNRVRGWQEPPFRLGRLGKRVRAQILRARRALAGAS